MLLHVITFRMATPHTRAALAVQRSVVPTYPQKEKKTPQTSSGETCKTIDAHTSPSFYPPLHNDIEFGK